MTQDNDSETISDLMTRYEAEATAHFAWKWEDTPIADQTWPLAVASDPDGMLIDACERQDAGEEGVIDPFWATTWRAASGLDRHLKTLDLDGKRVLEVGCGTGHAGVAAALRGASVVLTDGVDDPLLLVRMSVLPITQSCEVKRLRFGLDVYENPETGVAEKFPIILGSDVTYLRQLWPELLESLEQHLASDGVAYLSDPYRLIANEFTQWIADKPWSLVQHKIAMDDDPEHPIRVMELTRSQA